MAEGWKWIRRNEQGEIVVEDRPIIEGDYIRFPGDKEPSRIQNVKGKGLCVVVVGMLKVNHPLSNFVGLRAEVVFKNDPQMKLPGTE